MKENQDKVTAKVKEMAETVTAANGSVLVIGLIEGEDENCIIGTVQGKPSKITEAIAKLVSNDSAGAVAKIIKEGMALGAIFKIAGRHAGKVEVETETNK